MKNILKVKLINRKGEDLNGILMDLMIHLSVEQEINEQQEEKRKIKILKMIQM